jgi:hypothetical protein
MGSAKRRIPNVRCLRGAAHGSARTCARLNITTTDEIGSTSEIRSRASLKAGRFLRSESKIEAMQFNDFEKQIFSIDQAIHREFSKRPLAVTEPRPSKDLADLRATVRRAAEYLILCADLDMAISRLRQDSEARSAVRALTIEAPLSRDDHRSAARRAFEATPREPSALPFYPYCSYLLELCNASALAEHDDGKSTGSFVNVRFKGKR